MACMYLDVFEPATFYFWIQKFPLPRSVFKWNSPDGIRIYSGESRPMFGKRLDTIFATSSDSKISGFKVHRLSDSLLYVCFFLFVFSTLWRASFIKKYPDSHRCRIYWMLLTEAVPTDSCGTGLRIPVC